MPIDAPLHITVLGSGTSTGVPVIGCRCPVCSSDDPRDNRTRSSLLIRYRDKQILIDASTDLRQQALTHHIDQIDAVLFTHTHADHVNGIDDLRVFNLLSGAPIPIYASQGDLDTLQSTFAYIFDPDQEEGYRPQLEPRPVDGPFDLFGLPVQPIPLIHGRGNSTGYRIGPFAYLTDCSEIPPDSLPLLEGLDTLIVDGLRHQPHVSHFNIEQAIAATAPLKPRSLWLTHLSHEIFHQRDDRHLAKHCRLAYDGLSLNV